MDLQQNWLEKLKRYLDDVAHSNKFGLKENLSWKINLDFRIYGFTTKLTWKKWIGQSAWRWLKCFDKTKLEIGWTNQIAVTVLSCRRSCNMF